MARLRGSEPVHYRPPAPPPPPGPGAPHIRGDQLVAKRGSHRSYHGGPVIARSVMGGHNPGQHLGHPIPPGRLPGRGGHGYPMPRPPMGGGLGLQQILGDGGHRRGAPPPPVPQGGPLLADAGHRRGGGQLLGDEPILPDAGFRRGDAGPELPRFGEDRGGDANPFMLLMQRLGLSERQVALLGTLLDQGLIG